MIYPFLRMRFTGAIWFQGEANAKDYEKYECQFPAMITDWRRKMNLPKLSFFFVQLAALNNDWAWPKMRAAQMSALKLDLVGYAVAIDLGDPTSPLTAIHSRRKQEVGRRLSLSCLAIQYGQKVVHTGPLVTNVNIVVSSDSVDGFINFYPPSAQGMHTAGTAACQKCCKESPFQFITKAGNYVKLVRAEQFSCNPQTLSCTIHSNDGHLKPVGIAYDYEGYPQCAVYNGLGGADDHMGIAATPFKKMVKLVNIEKSWLDRVFDLINQIRALFE